MRARWAFSIAAGGIIVAAIAAWLSPRFTAPAPHACPADAKVANLNFTFKDTGGRDVRLSDFKGKVLLLDFWATWCGPCKVEIPGFVDLYRTYQPRGFEVVGVVVMDEFKKAAPFAAQYKMNYTILDANERGDVEEAFGPFLGLPTTFVIARDGRICAKHLGLPPSKLSYPSVTSVKEAFEAEIKPLL